MRVRAGRHAAVAQERQCAGDEDRPAVGDGKRPPLHRMGREERRRFHRSLLRAERRGRACRAGDSRPLRQSDQDHLQDREPAGDRQPGRNRRGFVRGDGRPGRSGGRTSGRGDSQRAAAYRGALHSRQTTGDHRYADALFDGALRLGPR